MACRNGSGEKFGGICVVDLLDEDYFHYDPASYTVIIKYSTHSRQDGDLQRLSGQRPEAQLKWSRATQDPQKPNHFYSMLTGAARHQYSQANASPTTTSHGPCVFCLFCLTLLQVTARVPPRITTLQEGHHALRAMVSRHGRHFLGGR